MGIISILLGLVDPISRIAGKIADYKIAAQQASTDKERIAADERVKALEARRDVMVSEAGSRVNAFMRAAIAFGPTVYLLKIFVVDKVLKLGTTDNLSDDLWKVVVAVVGFYFLYDIAARWKR